jgi:HD-like signal output (HDOD) protein
MMHHANAVSKQKKPATSIAGIYSQIYQNFASGKAKLPSLPDIVVKIRDAVSDPRSSSKTVARIIQADPALTAYLVKVANSPFYRTLSPAKDIKMAVSRMGLRSTRNLLTSYVFRSLYKTDSIVLKRRLNELRRQSIRIAAISYVLASSCPGFSPDRVMLAGLLQDIGALAVLIELEKRPQIAGDDIKTKTAISALSAMVGVLVLQQWKFDEEIIEVIRSREKWMRDQQPKADMADIVLIARLHSFIGTPLMAKLPQINEIPAFSKLPLGELTPGQSLKLVVEARQEVAQLEKLLGA